MAVATGPPIPERQLHSTTVFVHAHMCATPQHMCGARQRRCGAHSAPPRPPSSMHARTCTGVPSCGILTLRERASTSFANSNTRIAESTGSCFAAMWLKPSASICAETHHVRQPLQL
eukprot:365712-Chlamydomonas_euryale.AAC.13